jgi:hypothetical protein
MPEKRRRQPRKFVGAEEHARNKAYGRQYRKNRERVLGRDRRCALRLPGCTGFATETDHIVEAGRGGPSSVQNLQPACLHCNRAKQQARKAALSRREKSPGSLGVPSADELDGFLGGCASLKGGPHDLRPYGGPAKCWGTPGHASRDW